MSKCLEGPGVPNQNDPIDLGAPHCSLFRTPEGPPKPVVTEDSLQKETSDPLPGNTAFIGLG